MVIESLTTEQIKVFNSTMIVLSSASAVHSVMDKQGSSTGGRPRTLMAPIFRGLYVSFENMGQPELCQVSTIACMIS